MQPLEIAASVLTLGCVMLAVYRSLWQFPVGLAATAIFFVVVLDQRLYANAALQVVFVGVQIYGWWYWLRGDAGRRPPIRATEPWLVVAGCAGALAAAALAGWILAGLTDAAMPIPDAAVFGLSLVAQVLLDRKRIATWPVWLAVNMLSVWLYASQDLWWFAGLYVLLFANAFWGWREWLRAMRAQPGAALEGASA